METDNNTQAESQPSFADAKAPAGAEHGPAGFRFRRFRILCGDAFRHSLRSRRALIFLLLYLAVFLFIAYQFINIQERYDTTLTEHGLNSRHKKIVTAVARALFRTQAGSPLVDYLLTVPYFNIMLALVSIFGTPLLILFWKYDVLAQEIYDRTTRFLVFRASRLEFLLARYASGMMEVFLLTLVAFFLSMLWASATLSDFEWTKSFTKGFSLLLTSQAFFSVILALTVMCSTIVRRPLSALLLSFGGILFLLLMTAWLPLLSPFASLYFRGLFAGIAGNLVPTIIVYALFTGLFLRIGYSILRRRDL